MRPVELHIDVLSVESPAQAEALRAELARRLAQTGAAERPDVPDTVEVPRGSTPAQALHGVLEP
jgi:hypothetical protein